MTWWQQGTKMLIERQASHLIMTAIIDEEVGEIVHELTDDQVYAADGVNTLMRALDEHF